MFVCHSHHKKITLKYSTRHKHRWVCKVCIESKEKDKNSNSSVVSAAVKSAIDTLQNTMSSFLQLVNHTIRLGPGDARAKLVIGKLFWMCLALVRVSDVSLDSSRLMKVALQALAVISNKKDLLKHAVETARPDDATCAWIEGVQQTMYDGGGEVWFPFLLVLHSKVYPVLIV